MYLRFPQYLFILRPYARKSGANGSGALLTLSTQWRQECSGHLEAQEWSLRRSFAEGFGPVVGSLEIRDNGGTCRSTRPRWASNRNEMRSFYNTRRSFLTLDEGNTCQYHKMKANSVDFEALVRVYYR